jgi:hypothetical protein
MPANSHCSFDVVHLRLLSGALTPPDIDTALGHIYTMLSEDTQVNAMSKLTIYRTRRLFAMAGSYISILGCCRRNFAASVRATGLR